MDRRQYYRFNLNLKVCYRVLESLKPYSVTSSEDMSELGIKMNLEKYIEPGTRLELVMNITNDPTPLMVIGRVVWSRKVLSGGFFTTGIHIVHIGKADRERFYQNALIKNAENENDNP